MLGVRLTLAAPGQSPVLNEPPAHACAVFRQSPPAAAHWSAVGVGVVCGRAGAAGVDAPAVVAFLQHRSVAPRQYPVMTLVAHVVAWSWQRPPRAVHISDVSSTRARGRCPPPLRGRPDTLAKQQHDATTASRQATSTNERDILRR